MKMKACKLFRFGLLYIVLLLLAGCGLKRFSSLPGTPLPPVREAQIAVSAPVATSSPVPLTPLPTAVPTPSPTPVPTPFSIVWIPDTQNYARNQPEVFFSMRDWILENKEEKNVVFAVHSGDIVDGYSETMWNNANEALVPLFEAIPGLTAGGNHDITKSFNYRLYLKQTCVKMTLAEGQLYEGGQAVYALFSAGGTDFILMSFSYQVRGAAFPWAVEVLNAYPDRTAILLTHSGLNDDGSFTSDGKNLKNYVAAKCPNVRLLLCGHMRGAARRTDYFDDDGDGITERAFTSLMFNFQEDRVQGLGYLRLLTFMPENRSIEVVTYSPYLDSDLYPNVDPDQCAFTLTDAY